jgi:uncharacterized SAM-dependent methyltransferase
MTLRTGSTAGLRVGPYHAPDFIRAEVIRGLLGSPKSLPPKLFYDRAGARLFEAICELPEYYLTRTELGILRHRAEEIVERCGEHTALIEYGSGAGVKVRVLLDHLRNPAAYVPVDISMEQLAAVAAERARQYPHLRVAPVCADYTARFTLPTLPDARRVAFFGLHHRTCILPSDGVSPPYSRHDWTAAFHPGVDRRKDAASSARRGDAAGVTARSASSADGSTGNSANFD